jgi:hypothetical protein
MILHVPVYDKRLSEDEGEWSDEDEENELRIKIILPKCSQFCLPKWHV